MRRAKYKKIKKLQPNYLEYSGNYPDVPISMQLFIYNEDVFHEYNNLSLSEMINVINQAEPDTVKWFNLHGLHDIELLREIGSFFAIESYIMAEILNFGRRTRMEELEDIMFFSVKAILPFREEESIVDVEQISFILKEDVLLSFQEKKGDFFNLIRERIRTKTGQTRKRDTSYLLYGLLDSLMDSFLTTLDWFEDNVEMVLIEAKSRYKKETLIRIEEYTQELQDIKRAIIPLREVLYNLRDKKSITSSVISKNSISFFERLQYKSIEMLDQIEYNLNKLDSATNYFFASQSNRMNEIMKVLTIVSVIFIPLTFIVGIYGMNFDNMPELHSPNGYYWTLAAMLLIVLFMIIYFKWKKWF
ncbi:magnesium/cobalt transporter CorA [Myroides indicus]|uniref:Magnesium transport protein CorA n=1 Tax=Myroides indicus TaxID=1323422 RepID=A0A4R7F7W0_9FLAO|nr:magnesium/cobalt transporter CorA [Myroides indicus]TDS64317.1 magnesium transporter [Myroides indicus]